MAYTILAWAWAKVAETIELNPEKDSNSFYKEQRELADFGLNWLSDEGLLAWSRVNKQSEPLPWI